MDTNGHSTLHTTDAKERLIEDLKLVIKDAEDLLRHTGQQTTEGFRNAKAKFESTLETAKAELHNLEDAVVTRTKEAAQATDEYVRENPWKAVGIGAGIGLVVGMLISRR